MKQPIGSRYVALERVVLVPSKGGVFEVTADGELVFSKKGLGRHAKPGEVLERIQMSPSR